MQADRPWAIAIALEARLINKINGFKLRLTHLLFMQKYSNIKKYKGQMEKFTQWYKSYHAQDDTGYISGQKHGIIVETKYKNEKDPEIQTLEKLCKKKCQSTWSIGFFPPKFKGITFRFFSDDDLNMFNNVLKRMES